MGDSGETMEGGVGERREVVEEKEVGGEERGEEGVEMGGFKMGEGRCLESVIDAPT